MRIRATASATARSNAVGTVELECTPHGLVVGLFGVGAFTEGYAPAALVTGTQLVVPWSAVRQARADGDQVFLELDVPALPHNRLTLTDFVTGDTVHPRELRKQRLLLQLGALGIGALASLLAAAVVPRLSSQTTAGLTLGVGLGAAISVLGIGYFFDRRLLGASVPEPVVRSAFLGELETYYPALVRSPTAPLTPTRAKPLPDLAGFLPRTVAAIAITLTAGILTALLGGRHLLAPAAQEQVAARSDTPSEGETPAKDEAIEPIGRPAGTPEAETAAAAPGDAAAAESAEAPAAPTPASDLRASARCVCERSTSPLWSEPIPVMSVLLLEERKIQKKNHTRTSLEIAIVNNGREALEEITVHVSFFEGQGKDRELTKDRPLYFEGPLQPGQAIKWTTEARGTEWKIEPPNFGEISPDAEGTAPAAAFRELLAAKNRPVRLHAARMLAFLGDPEAEKATLQLKDALRSAEAGYLRRLQDALAAVRVCNLSVTGKGATRRVEACVYNSTDADRDNLGVQLVALDKSLEVSRPLEQPPALLGDRKWPLPAALPAQSGVLISVPVDLEALHAENAKAFEMSADRFDLLD
jgi:hypothetical protein